MIDQKLAQRDAMRSLNDRIGFWAMDEVQKTDKLGAGRRVLRLRCRLWANVSMIRGHEVTEHGKIVVYERWKIFVHRMPATVDFHAKGSYIRHKGDELAIESVRPLGRYLELICKRRVG